VVSGFPEGSVSNPLVVYYPFPRDRVIVPNDTNQLMIRQERYFIKGLTKENLYFDCKPGERIKEVYEEEVRKRLRSIVPGFSPYLLINGRTNGDSFRELLNAIFVNVDSADILFFEELAKAKLTTSIPNLENKTTTGEVRKAMGTGWDISLLNCLRYTCPVHDSDFEWLINHYNLNNKGEKNEKTNNEEN